MTLDEEFKYEPETGKLFRRCGPGFLFWKECGNTPSPSGYGRVMYNRTSYLTHRLIWRLMTGEWPKDEIDHINRNRMDNRWINLRVVDRIGNAQNLSLRLDNKSGVAGVTWYESRQAWYANITVEKRKVFLGWHKNFNEAVAARKAAEDKYWRPK